MTKDWEKRFNALRHRLRWTAPELIKDQYMTFIEDELAKQRTQLLKEVREKVIKTGVVQGKNCFCDSCELKNELLKKLKELEEGK